MKLFEWNRDEQIIAEIIPYSVLDDFTHLVIKPYEVAIFIHNGENIGIVESGRHRIHTLSETLPLLGPILKKWSGKQVEVFYLINNDINLKWFGLNWLSNDNVRIGASGSSIVQISKPMEFCMNLMGGQKSLTISDIESELSSEINSQFRNVINQNTSRELYSSFDDLKEPLSERLNLITDRWGIVFISWSMNWIVPDEIMEYWEKTKGLRGDAEKEELLRQYMLQDLQLKEELKILSQQKDFEREQDLKDLEVMKTFLETTTGYEQQLKMQKIKELHQMNPELAEKAMENDTLIELGRQSPQAAAESAKAFQYKHKKPGADLQEIHTHVIPGMSIGTNIQVEENKIRCTCGSLNSVNSKFCVECGKNMQYKKTE